MVQTNTQMNSYVLLAIVMFILGPSLGLAFENTAGPGSDPDDLTVWPNRVSRANSDPWLAEHHDSIRRMNPRVMLINSATSVLISRLIQPSVP